MDYKIEENNVLIKDYLRNTLKISAKTMIKLKPKGIFVNGVHARVVDFMNKGDILTINSDDKLEKEYPKEDVNIEVLFEDDNLILVNKPFGMPVYPAGEHMQGSLLAGFANRYKNQVFRPIYRLDRNTSGIVCIAKNRMSVTVSNIKKTYIAICHGVVPVKGEIKSPISLENGSRIKRCTGQGQSAHTTFERLSHNENYSLVKVNIFTGRTHQIRVHMSSIGFPLVGDDLYGGKTDIMKRHALHCYKVGINSPTLKIEKEIKTEIPQDFIVNFPDLFERL